MKRIAKIMGTCVLIGSTLFYQLGCGKKVNGVGPEPVKTPVLHSVEYNNGKATTNQKDITGTLKYKNPADSAIVKINNASEQRLPIKADSTINITLEEEGENILETRIKGEGGLSNSEKDTIIIDRKGPTSTSISIPEYTNLDTILARVSATGADLMKFTGDLIDTTGFMPYDTLKSLVLSQSEGPKSVYVFFKDKAGNIAKDSAIIILDQEAPKANSITIPKHINKRDTLAILSATGADSMKLWGDITNKSFRAYKDTANISILGNQGKKNVYVIFKDKAGNISIDTLEDIAYLDTIAPIIPATFKDTTLNDNTVNFGDFQTNGLVIKYANRTGAVSDSMPLDSLNYAIYPAGTTDVSVVLGDSARNTATDTKRVITSMLDSAGIDSLFLGYYSGKGHSPNDSLKQKSVTDSITYKTYADSFHVFELNSNLKHNLKATDDSTAEIIRAADHMTAFNKKHEFADRFLVLAKDWSSKIFKEINEFYLENKQ